MRNREAYNLKRPMFVYNFILVVLNLYFFVKVASRSRFGKLFMELDYHESAAITEEKLQDVYLVYGYFLTKFLDWIDTIFLILRKKNSHVSFLHVYHHSMVPVLAYMCLKLNPFMPPGFLFALCNSFVHTVMYSYYFLSLISTSPKFRKYLWWKKYITQMQLGQFAFLGIFGFIYYQFQTGYPPVLSYFAMTQPPVFFFLFYNFYKKSYKVTNDCKKSVGEKRVYEKLDNNSNRQREKQS